MSNFAYSRCLNKAFFGGWRVKLLSELVDDLRMPLATIGLLLGLIAGPAGGCAAEVAGYQPAQSPLPGEPRSDPTPTISKVSRQVYRVVVQGDDFRRGGTGFL